MTKSQSTPLIHDPTAIPLYDPQALLSMEASLAKGYIVLLSGGDPAPLDSLEKNRIRRSAVQMGFFAITEGNVLETCFGTTQIMSQNTKKKIKADSAESRSITQVRRVKVLLADAVDSSEAIRKLAVGTYLKAFEVVVHMHQEIDQLNFFTKCFFYRAIVHKAQVDLQEIFAKLQEAIQAST